ncbi:hypothetical protein Tco_1317926 [Tanacetum coccineum]
MFKWVWRFTTQKTSLWARVIKPIHGDDGKIGRSSKSGHTSIWCDIVHEMDAFKKQGTDFYSFMQKKLGNGANTFFWEDVWRENMALKHKYPRLYELELNKNIEVAAKLAQTSLVCSFRREPRSGVEHSQLVDLLAMIEGVSLGVINDRWTWALEGSGDFSAASVRKLIDDKRLPVVSYKTRWIKAVPIKVNPMHGSIEASAHVLTTLLHAARGIMACILEVNLYFINLFNKKGTKMSKTNHFYRSEAALVNGWKHSGDCWLKLDEFNDLEET